MPIEKRDLRRDPRSRCELTVHKKALHQTVRLEIMWRLYLFLWSSGRNGEIWSTSRACESVQIIATTRKFELDCLPVITRSRSTENSACLARIGECPSIWYCNEEHPRSRPSLRPIKASLDIKKRVLSLAG